MFVVSLFKVRDTETNRLVWQCHDNLKVSVIIVVLLVPSRHIINWNCWLKLIYYDTRHAACPGGCLFLTEHSRTFLTAGILTMWISVGRPHFFFQGVDHLFSLPLYFYVTRVTSPCRDWSENKASLLQKMLLCIHVFLQHVCPPSTVYEHVWGWCAHLHICVCAVRRSERVCEN